MFSVSQIDLFNNSAATASANNSNNNPNSSNVNNASNELQLPIGGSNMSTCSSMAPGGQFVHNNNSSSISNNTQLLVARNSILISTQDIHKLVSFFYHEPSLSIFHNF
jgi:hypothetical protein